MLRAPQMFNPKQHLSRQLAFLQRSSAAYDAGYVEKAVRLAVVIRVLCHNTKNSTSLLKHLNATTIALSSSSIDLAEKYLKGTVKLRTMLITTHSKHGVAVRPILGDGDALRPVLFSRWWTHSIFIDGNVHMSRRLLVLAAANQDGGAHVDSSINDAYEWLAQDGSFAQAHFEVNQTTDKRLVSKDAHFALLRQIANELLHSQELLNFAESANSHAA